MSHYNINGATRIAPQFDGVAPFADPFTDLASVVMPMSVPAMLRHAEFFANADATLRGAYERVVAYFLTDIVVDGELGEDERDKQKEYLIDRTGVIPFLFEHGLNHLVYGNAFLTASMAFTRYVKCPRCQVQYRLTEFQRNPKCSYRWSSGVYGKCFACGYGGVFAVVGVTIDVLLTAGLVTAATISAIFCVVVTTPNSLNGMSPLNAGICHAEPSYRRTPPRGYVPSSSIDTSNQLSALAVPVRATTTW
jgi:hypothetical protein